MKEKYAKAEIKYRLIQIVLRTLSAEGLVYPDEVDVISEKAARKFKPPIGLLDWEGDYGTQNYKN